MKSFILSIILIAVMQFSFGQDKPVKYSKVITVNSLNKNELFDKVLFWFNRSFYNDQDKIKVNNREAGILSGQATFYSAYRISKNSDSTAGVDFANYSLEWTIKINNNRIAFDVTKIYLNGTIPVTTTTKKSSYHFLSIRRTNR